MKPTVYNRVNLSMCVILTTHYFLFAFLRTYALCSH